MARTNRRFFVWAATGLIALAAMAAGRAEAARTLLEIANYQGADRQAKLEAGAREEGELLVYTTGTQTEPMMERFREKYPFIRLEVYRAGSVDVTRRIVEEYAAGRHVADVILLSTGGLHEMKNRDILQPYSSPELAHYKPDAIEPGKHWVIEYESYLNLGWNTDALQESEVPKTYQDLLDPKWKGKMAVSGRATTLGNWVGVAVLEFGEDYVRKLGRQDITVYEVSGRALANFVVSGETPLSPAIYSSHMANSKAKGAAVAWRALGPVYATIGGAALASQAPHPNAAMLMLDFSLSKEGQQMRQELGYATARTDLKNAEKPDKIHYVTERPNYAQEFERWTRLADEVFGKGQKPPKRTR